MAENLYPEEVHATLMTTRQLSIGGARIPALRGNHFFVDYDLGNNGFSGKSWDKAWATITYALANVSDWDTLWVVGRGSEETLTIPVGLDHFTLRGASVGQRSWHLENNAGAVTDANIRCRAQAFTLMDVFIEPPAGGAAVVLVRDASEAVAKANYATLVNVNIWTGKYGVDLQGAPHGFTMVGGSIRNLRADGATAIKVSSQSVTFPYRAHLKRVVFKGNVNHIVGGFADSVFEELILSAKASSNNDTTTKLDLRNGSSNDVFECQLGGTYSEAGGYYASGAEDNWIGNFGSAGVTTGNPA